MIRIHPLFVLCITAFVSAVALAEKPLPASAGVTAEVAALGYAREMPPGAPLGAAYLQLRNSGAHVRVLQQVELPAYPEARVELHTTQLVDGVSRMRPVKKLSVPAHGVLEMGPGATHLMVHGVRLMAGDRLELQLVFADGDVQQLVLPVLGLSEPPPTGMRAEKPEGHHHHHHHGHG
ncbi:copper chaperone PCu(A)C [Microbulbifer elongatus]|uniref:copper chaperone PCu(A)C n=1 Tax=Microbulbifer elongatus TaxID=86173 RepID=UPI001E4107C8|nr:copper chaperone PCu(A)C [Microbulbifer elongatus]